ncbi:MAG: response regulator transcription factor [Treponema sp.]|uniref:response regulator transcription factor n=1 Tax=Treponema sp. TaxID=166 RepID=UPI002A91BDCB|nr:response regulator transcription factor [Treponema sp.]MDY6397249.1 response regulator transcription factor [Treponema sp.]
MVYILEDDDNIRKLINYSLKSQGFEVQDFALPSTFWSALQTTNPDLLLLDIMLPEEDGISILKRLRSNPKTSTIPVIMLTAKDSEYDVVTGLDSGADDYVTKPFGMMALVSRIKAVLRRYEKSDSHKELLEAGGIKIDENQHTVFAGNQQLFLTVKEFDLLVLLIKNRGNVLTREQLLESVWGLSSEIESRTVDVHIRTLRAKLGEYEKNIETIRGVGYKFN